LIGYSVIDLEDKLFSSKRRREYFAIDRIKRYNQQRLTKEKNRRKSVALKKKIDDYISLKDSFELDFVKDNPIEFRTLQKDNISLGSGSIQFILDIMTQKEAEKMIPLQLEKPKIHKYEIRLIIWSLSNIHCE